jgi:hypothetical protein
MSAAAMKYEYVVPPAVVQAVHSSDVHVVVFDSISTYVPTENPFPLSKVQMYSAGLIRATHFVEAMNASLYSFPSLCHST